VSETVVPYEFIMKSNPIALDTSNLSFRNFSNIYISSDIYSFFPYLEVEILDAMGVVLDQLYFIEGLEFNVKFGNIEVGYLEHNYCWSENQILDCRMANHISGTNLFIMLSNYYSLDSPVSRAWTQLPLSTVISTMLATDWKLIKNPVPLLNKVNISITDLPYDWCQANKTNSQFITSMSEVASNLITPFSPFVTFINSAGEFYFSTIADLFLIQLPVAEFVLEMAEDTMYNPAYLKAVEVYFGGMPVNKSDYEKNIFTITGTGDYDSQTANIQNHITKSPIDKIPIRRQYVKTNEILNLGLSETITDKRITQGRINNFFVDSALATRMGIMVDFHPKLVAGKLVKLSIGSALATKPVGIELSGTWLIIKNEIVYDFSGRAQTRLQIAKSAATMDIQNPFLIDFLI